MQTKKAKNNQPYSRPKVASIFLIVGVFILIASMILAISVGAAKINIVTVFQSLFFHTENMQASQIITEIRLPREIGAMAVGAALAVSGAIMQGMTKNALADPGLLGLNAGASLALACVFAFFPHASYSGLIIASFIGAGVGALMVFGIGAIKRGTFTPIRMTLAGAAVSALLTGLGQGMSLYFKLSQNLAFWSNGGVSGTNWSQLKIIVPVIIFGVVVAIIFSRNLTVLSFGDDIATGLGQRTFWTKILMMFIVLLLAGTAVSMVGSIAFVGLMIPHIVRFLVGTNYVWIIPCSALLGSIFLVLSDTIARTINAPYETPLGAIVSIVGIPFFFYLIRKGGAMFK